MWALRRTVWLRIHPEEFSDAGRAVVLDAVGVLVFVVMRIKMSGTMIGFLSRPELAQLLEIGFGTFVGAHVREDASTSVNFVVQ